MAYFWINQAQEYLQSLGFGSTLPPVNAQQQQVKVDQYGGDNSFQTDKPFRIRYGKGGVDDAEDAEVIVHEYGHAVHAAQVPGFGASEEAGSIGEAFGDYLGVTVGLAADQQYRWPNQLNDPACVMDWDSTAYTSTVPHCLRRLDSDLTVADKNGEVHHDGMIWSRALWDIRGGYAQLGLGTRRADTTIIDAQFQFAADTSFSAAAKATYGTALGPRRRCSGSPGTKQLHRTRYHLLSAVGLFVSRWRGGVPAARPSRRRPARRVIAPSSGYLAGMRFGLVGTGPWRR
jgi:hypothetical protein